MNGVTGKDVMYAPTRATPPNIFSPHPPILEILKVQGQIACDTTRLLNCVKLAVSFTRKGAVVARRFA